MAGSFFQELKRRNVFRVAAIYVVVSWLLMQIADVMFPALRLPEWAPTLLVAFLLLGFPLALVFAWAFELTPEGVARTVDVPEEESITAVTGHRLNYTIIGTLAVAVVFLLIKDILLDQPPTPHVTEDIGRSIAVLPFKNQSASAENAEFFAGGLHDELLTLLSKLGELKVISRTSVERLDPDLSIPEIGELLGVATVLEGQVQRAGDRLRINVQLIDTVKEGHIWANTYDSQLTATNIFEVQGDIARTIAEALHAELSPDDENALAAVPTRNTEALEKYLLGIQIAKRGSFSALQEAEQYQRQATRLDPEYAEAWAALADSYASRILTGAISYDEYLEGARPAVANAVKHGPELAIAQTQKALLLWYEGDDQGSEAAFRKALEMDPRNTVSLNRYGKVLRLSGRHEEAREVLTRALETDPLSTATLFELGKVEMYLGDPESFLRRANRVLEIDPSSAYANTGRLQSNLWMGRIDRAWPIFLEAIDADPLDYENWAHLAAHSEELGMPDVADRYLARALELGPNEPAVLKCQALILLMRERFDEALDIALGAIESGIDARWGSDLVFLRIIRDHALATSEFEIALKHYRNLIPEFFEPVPDVEIYNIVFVPDVARLLRAAGDHARADVLLEAGLAWYDANQVTGVYGYDLNIVDVEMLAVAGRKDEALQRLSAAVDYGWRTDWSFFLKNRNLDSIAGSDAFLSMKRLVEDDVRRQGETVRALPDQGAYDLRNN